MYAHHDDTTEPHAYPPAQLRPAIVGSYAQVWLDDAQYQISPGLPDILDDGRVAVWVWHDDCRVLQLPNLVHDPGFVVWDHDYAARSQEWKNQLVDTVRDVMRDHLPV